MGRGSALSTLKLREKDGNEIIVLYFRWMSCEIHYIISFRSLSLSSLIPGVFPMSIEGKVDLRLLRSSLRDLRMHSENREESRI